MRSIGVEPCVRGLAREGAVGGMRPCTLQSNMMSFFLLMSMLVSGRPHLGQRTHSLMNLLVFSCGRARAGRPWAQRMIGCRGGKRPACASCHTRNSAHAQTAAATPLARQGAFSACLPQRVWRHRLWRRG
eukprot:3251088-Pleurochrysis_carterae.AAC.1